MIGRLSFLPAILSYNLGEAEVNENEFVVGLAEEKVVGVDVAMNDPKHVQRRQIL